MEQAGLAETIAESISTLPEDLQGLFWSNVGLIGGNTCIPGFEQRLYEELRPLALADCELGIYKDEKYTRPVDLFSNSADSNLARC